MAWFKVDDQLHSHPKVRRAGLEAMGLWLLAGSHCMSYLTDGFIEEWFVKSWPHGDELAELLVEQELWIRVDNGWQFHDWEEFQPTRESVKKDREAAAERMRRLRANRQGSSGEHEANVQGKSQRSSVTPSPSPSVLKNTKRGTRVSDSFEINQEMRDWAKEEAPLVNLDSKLPEFLDYWRSVPGSKGVKLDWVSTWRNAMRKQQEFALRDRGPVSGKKVKRF